MRRIFIHTILLTLGMTCWANTPTSESERQESQQQINASAISEQQPSCLLGDYRAKITPERMRTFLAPGQGDLADWVVNQPRLKKNDIIATINRKEIELEEIDLNLKIRKDRLTKEEELSNLEKQLNEIEFYLKLSKKEKQWTDKRNESNELKAKESIIKKMEILKDDLASFEEKVRFDFEKKKESFILTMPFDGMIQYQFNLPKNGETSLYVESGMNIATICDDSAYYVTISISNPQLTAIDPETLHVELPLNNQQIIKGTFSHKRVEKNSSSGGDMLAYFFKIPVEHHKTAHNMIGSNLISKLFYTPSEPIQFFDKIQLVKSPQAKTFASWQELMQALYPDYELIVVGETQIIARKK